jgi:hypothetical protein
MPPTMLRPRLSSGPDQVIGDAPPPSYDLSYRDEFWPSRAYEDRCDRLALRVKSVRLDAATIDEIAPGPVRRRGPEDDTCGS